MNHNEMGTHSLGRAEDLIEQLVDRQRLDWRDGKQKLVESYLEAYPYQQHHGIATLELCYNEVLLRQESGETPEIQEYVRRFPKYENDLRRQFEVHVFFEEATRDVSSVGPISLQSDTPPIGSAITPPIDSNPARATSAGPVPAIPGYEIRSLIGRGGSGLVYLATQESTGQEVAVKVLHTAEQATESEIRRFRRESQAIGRLRHASIVRILDAGVANQMHFLVMECIDGEPLSQRVGDRQLSTEQAVEIAIELAEALGVAHASGVIHRDIKPQNIILEQDGTPRLVDFGLAKFEECSLSWTQTGQLVGTLPYMAPEQANGRGEEIGVQTDVYGLGAVLYFMLCGRPPHEGDSLTEMLAMVSQRTPAPIPSESANIDLRTVCMKCLQKSKSDRYGSAIELSLDLKCVRDGTPIAARPLRITEQWTRSIQRNPLMSGLVGTLVLATVMLVAGSTAAAFKFHRDGNSLRSMVTQLTLAESAAKRSLVDSYVMQVEQRVRTNQAGALEECRDVIKKLSDGNAIAELDPDRLLRLRNSVIHALSADEIIATKRAPGSTQPVQQRGRTEGKTHRLTTNAENRVLLHDRDGNLLFESSPIVGSVVFSEWIDESMLVIVSNQKVMVACGPDFELRRIDVPHAIENAKLHANEGLLAVWSGKDVSVIDFNSDTDIVTRHHSTGAILSLAWHPRAATLAIGSDDHFAYVFEACELDQPRMVIEGSRGWINKVAILESGKLVVSCDRENLTR
ncbi:MAG: serine/threonine-protein kinase, partial [Planctomycetota bacterium]